MDKKIKNIIFDLGKVLTEINFENTTKAFSTLGNFNASKFISYQNQSAIFDDVETGKLSAEQFRAEIRKLFKIFDTDIEIDRAWNAMIGKTTIETLELVHSLRPKYKTFILSNTNQIHIDCVAKQLQKDYGINSLNDYFDKVYFSHKIGSRKPEKEAYLYVLNQNKLIPEETIFIDDKQENLDGAKVVGIQTILKTEDVSLLDILENYL